MSISSNAMQKLIDTPPSPLVEVYYECKMTIKDAIFDTFGIAFGNILLVRLAVVVFLGMLFVTVGDKFYTPKMYKFEDRNRILQTLAYNLLRIRDVQGIVDGNNNMRHSEISSRNASVQIELNSMSTLSAIERELTTQSQALQSQTISKYSFLELRAKDVDNNQLKTTAADHESHNPLYTNM
jgi:hypothetical protein